MLSEISKLKTKDQAFLLASLRFSRKQTPQLLQYLPQTRAQELKSLANSLAGLSKAEAESQVASSFAALQGKGQESLFEDCEPSWIAELLKGESPEVLALILQRVAKPRLGKVLKDLSKESRKALREVSAEKVPAWVPDFIWERAQRRFPSIDRQRLREDPVLSLLADKPLEALYDLLRELGIQEMAVAFCKVHRSGIRALLARLHLEDARELRRRIKEGLNPTLTEQRESQLHILSIEFEKLKPEEIIQEIGFGVLSLAFGKEHRDFVNYLVYRFPPTQGYTLKRYLDLRLQHNPAEKVAAFRQKIISACERIP